MCDGTFNVVEAAQQAGVRKWSRPPRPRSTGWRRLSRPTSATTRTTTAPCTARPRCWKGCCVVQRHVRPAYVALRYFNVYGPRMDIHGKYTEVLIRWMERIDAGQPPLILGDGTPDHGLRLRRRRGARQRLALASDAADEVLQRREPAPRPASTSSPQRCAESWASSCTRTRAGAHGEPRAAPAGPTEKAERMLGFKASVTSRKDLPRLVTWWRASASGYPHEWPMNSRRAAVARRARGRGGPARHPVRLGHAGAGGRGLRARVRRRRRRAARLRRVQLHDGAAPGAVACGVGPATRSSRSATRSSPPPTPSATAARRRCSSTSSRTPSTSIRHRSRRRSSDRTKAILVCAPARACRAIWQRSSRSAGSRGMAVVEDAACAIGSEIRWDGELGAHRPAARRRRLLLVPPAQAAHDRRRRHADDGPMRTSTRQFRLLRQHGMSVPDTVRHASRARSSSSRIPCWASTTG